jgi:hypothetical protein
LQPPAGRSLARKWGFVVAGSAGSPARACVYEDVINESAKALAIKSDLIG